MVSSISARSNRLGRRTLSESIEEEILDRIMDGRLAPGERIVETQLAKEFGTSQAPVREALRALATLGVITLIPHKGASVRSPSESQLIDAINVRAELEALAARAAAERMDDACMKELESCMDRMLTSAIEGDRLAHARANADFHATIVRAAKNEALEMTWRVLNPFLRTYITANLPGVDLVWLARRHEGLMDAFKNRDPDRADALMRKHLEEVADATAGSLGASSPAESAEPVES